MAGTFEVYKDARREFCWRLEAGHGQAITTSGESYITRGAWLNGIDSVKSNAPDAELDGQTGGPPTWVSLAATYQPTTRHGASKSFQRCRAAARDRMRYVQSGN